MKQQVKAGGYLDALTPHELMAGLERHSETLLDKLGKNARFIRHVGNTQADGAGNFSYKIGPPDGFLWDVRGFSIAGNDSGAAADALVFINDSGSWANYIISQGISNATHNNYMQQLPGKFLVLHSSEVITFIENTPNNVPANAVLTFQVLAIEVPNSHEAQLLL